MKNLRPAMDCCWDNLSTICKLAPIMEQKKHTKQSKFLIGLVDKSLSNLIDYVEKTIKYINIAQHK